MRWMADNDLLLPGGARQPVPASVLQVARLYEAGLNREFDAPGLNHWIDACEAGVPLATVAAYFLDSPEFTRNHGDDDGMTNPQFVRTTCGNVLGRDPERSGFIFWIGGVNAGASRESVPISISDSPENVARSAYLQSLRQTAAGYWGV